MLYLIGLGLNVKGISQQGMETVKKCKKVYLECYTVDFPYSLGELSGIIDKKIISLNRENVENMKIIDEARKLDAALLVYGSPLVATTHISLVNEAKASGVKCKIIHNASILDAVSETGLQIYKFGKITSMPKWDKGRNFVSESFMDIVKENTSIKAHTLILADIGLEFPEAMKQLETSAKNKEIKLKKIIVCSCLGTKHQRILYGSLDDLTGENIRNPFCIIIPGNLHFMEREAMEKFEK